MKHIPLTGHWLSYLISLSGGFNIDSWRDRTSRPLRCSSEGGNLIPPPAASSALPVIVRALSSKARGRMHVMRGEKNDNIELPFFVNTCDLMISTSQNRSAACRSSQFQHNVHTVQHGMPNYSTELYERRHAHTAHTVVGGAVVHTRCFRWMEVDGLIVAPPAWQ